MSNPKINILVLIILTIIFSITVYYYIITNPTGSFPVIKGEGCDLSTHHLEYNAKKGIQECVEGAIDLGCDFSKNHIEYNEEKKEPKCVKISEVSKKENYNDCHNFNREITRKSSKCIPNKSVEQ